MRDGLTALAALAILALGAALLVPPLLDWRDWRGEIDMRLGNAIGLAVSSVGAVSVALLPHPRLSIGQLEVKAPEDQATGEGGGPLASIARLDLALSLPALIKGEIRVLQTDIDGLDVRLRHDGAGNLLLPSLRPAAQGAAIALDQVNLSRSRLRLVGGKAGAERIIGPVAARLSTPALAGPWTIEAEIAGEPLRIVTGVHEAGKGFPLKLSSVTPARRIDADGSFDLPVQDGVLSPSWTGQAVLALKQSGEAGGKDSSGPGAAAPLLTATLRGTLAGGKLEAASLVVDLDEAGRLEGSGAFDMASGQPAALALASRRLNGEALPALIQALAHQKMPGWLAALLPAAEISLTADQIGWRGEEATDIAARMGLGPAGITMQAGSAQFAGLKLGFSGQMQPATAAHPASGSGEVKASAASLQRLALAAARLGLKPEAADALSGFGAVELRFRPVWQGDALALHDITATTRMASLAGRLSRKPDSTEITLALTGMDMLDLASLARSSLVPLLPEGWETRQVALDLALKESRFGAGPVGSANVRAQKSATGWRVEDFAASGFGGLSLTSLPADGAGQIRAELAAPDAAAVLAVAGLVLPPDIGKALALRARDMSPLTLAITIGPEAEGRRRWQARGKGGAAQNLVLNGQMQANRPLSIAGEATGETAALLRLASPFGSGLSPGLAGLLPQVLPSHSRLSFSAGLDLALAGQPVLLEFAAMAGSGFSASWQGAVNPGGPGRSGPFRLEQAGPDPVRLTGLLAHGESGFDLSQLDLKAGSLRMRGHLGQGRDEALEGELALEDSSPAALAALAFGHAPPDAAGGWSSQRFAPPPPLPRARIALSAAKMNLPGFAATSFQGQMVVDDGAIRLDGIRADLAGGRLSGSLRMGREGSQRSLGWRLKLDGADAGLLTDGRVTGRAEISLDGGTSGETAQRLAASLSGTGQVNLKGAVMTAMSPAALSQALEEGEAKGSMSDLARGFATALQAGNWTFGEIATPLTLSAGVLRAGPVTSTGPQSRLSLSGSLNLRSLNAELSAQMSPLVPARQGEGIAMAGIVWRGPVHDLKREIDINGVRNVLAMRELNRELERVEAFQADLRERSFFARRLRQERDTRERETREREAAIRAAIAQDLRERQQAREEALRLLGRSAATGSPAPNPLPETSGPMQILPP